MRRLSTALLGALAIGVIGLSACGKPQSAGGAGDTTMRRGIGSDPDSLDPQQAEGTWANDVIGDMFIGLFTEDASAKPMPGVAQTWTTSPDGLVWTFRLRPWQWSDGTPLTAEDFVYSFRRLMDPKNAAAVYASIQYGIKNARAVKSGEMPLEALGVKALDAETLEMTLEYPMPYLPGVLKHYSAYPVPKHVIDKFGEKWTSPENIVVNGPYKLTAWVSGDSLRSVVNDKFDGAADLCLKEIVYYPAADHDAMVRRAMAGEIDMNNSFPTGQLEATTKNLPGWPRVSPMAATTYVVANQTRKPFSDARVRKALALAIDREYITGQILKGGEIPLYNFVPQGMAGYPQTARFSWADTPRADRLKEAAKLLQEAGFGPGKPFSFEYTYRDTGNNPRIAPVMQQNWADIAPWVKPEILAVQTQTLYNKLQQKDYQVSDTGWVADFNDAYNFLYLLESRTGPMNYGAYKNPKFDALISASNMEMNTVKRADLLRQAEQLMLDDTALIPILNRVSQDIVSPNVTGFEDNPEDIHRTRFMCKVAAAK